MFKKDFKTNFSNQILVPVFTLAIVVFSNVQAFAQTAPDEIVNIANVSASTTDPDNSNNTASTTDLLCYSADLGVTFADTAITIEPLDDNTYTATVTNIGPSTVTELSFTLNYNEFDYPTIGTVTSTSGTVGTPTTVLDGVNSTYTNSLTALTLGPTQSLDIIIPVTASANPLASIDTSFEVTPSAPNNNDPLCTIVDPDLNNNTAEDTTNGTLIADVALVKISSGGADSSNATVGKLTQGTDATYTMTVSNNGPSRAVAPITITDTLDSKITPTLISGNTCTTGVGSTVGLDCTWDSNTRQMTLVYNSDLPVGDNISIVTPVFVTGN